MECLARVLWELVAVGSPCQVAGQRCHRGHRMSGVLALAPGSFYTGTGIEAGSIEVEAASKSVGAASTVAASKFAIGSAIVSDSSE
jgi:hypothetical protein